MKKFQKAVSLGLATLMVAGATMTSVSAASTSWNFKDSSFKNLGTIKSSTTIDGLKLVATSSKTMEVKKDSKTLDGTTYTYCLGLGGTGSTSYRAVNVPVAKNSNNVIKVVLKSSGSSTRSLIVADPNGNKLATLSAKKDISLQTYTYTGKNSNVYLYSAGSGINIYKIQVDTNGSSSGSQDTTEKATTTTTNKKTTTTTKKTTTTTKKTTTTTKKTTTTTGSSSNSGKTVTITKTITVGSGETYDGKGCKIVAKGLGDGGQGEGQKPFFKLENGASLKNVVLTAPGVDGIHCYGNNTLENVTWEDVGEDALTVKGGSSKDVGTINIKNCKASYAYDKLFQCNAPCTVKCTNVNAYDIGKFIRQNGSTSFKCTWYLDSCTIKKVKDSIARTDSKNTKCYYKNLTVSDCKTWWKFPSSSQVSTY